MWQTVRGAPLRLILVGLLGGATYSAHHPAAGGAGHPGLLGELARTGPVRAFAPRLSIPLEYRACSAHPSSAGTIPVTRCGTASVGATPSRAVLDLSARASAAVRAEVDPDALHAVALMEMLWADDAGNRLHESISSLQTVSRLADRPAPVLADLAAAHLVRAERMQTPRDLLEAVEAADRAVELEPRNPAALFNLALALDRLGLDGEAARAWREYRMVDSTSGWAVEAERRARALEVAYAPPSPPAAGASAAEIEAYAARAPQEARLLGWDRLLGEWGEAVLAGDSVRAEEKLRLAGAIGDALERRGGDATLADAVRAIRTQAGDRAATRRLAEAHGAYAAGRAAYLAVDYSTAGDAFAEALAVDAPSAPLSGWAGMFHAATLVHGGHRSEAEAVFRHLLAGTDTARDPALAGAAWWGLTTTLLRNGRHEEALEGSREAARLFERAGEDEHVGGTLYLAAQTEFNLGATVAAYTSIHQALTTLRPYRRSLWLCNLLSAAARTVEADGLTRTAIRLQDERVTVAERTDNSIYLAESLLGRAQVLTVTGASARARADIKLGEAVILRLPAGPARTWLEADLQVARAGVHLRTDPGRAEAALDSVVAASGGTRTALRQPRALVGRAEARLARGDAPGAMADLDRATLLVREQHAAVARAPLRASLLDAARQMFDRMAMVQIASGDTAAALRYLERGRTSFAPTGRRAPRSADVGWQIPHGRVAVEYALIGDTLLIWTVRGRTVRMTRGMVRREELVRTIERARSSLEIGAAEAATRPALAALYRLLVSPVKEHLGPDGTHLVLVADGEIAGIPFAALYDPDRRRYLVEDHPLHFAASLHDASGAAPDRRMERMEVLLVADPAFDARAHPGLERLPGATAEVDSIATAYPHRLVLADAAASRAEMERALTRAGIVHFAGHAVFDDQRPEESYLVLTPGSGTDRVGRLTAAEIEGMDLGHVRLVVLSACQSLRSRGGRSGGFAGFADGLLAAGVGGMVGSLWRVDDQLTRPLMVEFHRAYRRDSNGPVALREAQLRLLRSSDPALRSPAAWAGFRYAGN